MLLVLVFGSFAASQAQYIEAFTLDTANYTQELRALFGSQLDEQEEVVLEQFFHTWDSLDLETRTLIMSVSESMRQRSCRAKPQYFMFVQILEAFLGGQKPDRGFDIWMEGYSTFMEQETSALKAINKINDLTYLLLDRSVMFESVAINWKLKGGEHFFFIDDGLKVKVEECELVGISAGDSINIEDVSGVIDPVGQVLYATSGKVTWERAGLDPEEVYAELQQFNIVFNKTEYRADSVLFYHRQLLDESSRGHLYDRITRIRNREQAKFPQFTSYQSRYELHDIVPGMDYRGAISMQGANLVGTAAEGVNATLRIYQQDSLRVGLNSEQFLFGRNLVRSNNAEISIYIEDDSIYHPDLIFNYQIENELMRLTKSDDYNSQGPYSNSYHRVDMLFDELSWVRSEPFMSLQPALGTALGNGMFESYDFFNMESYQSLQGMDYQHPLAELWTYARMLGGDTFAVESYAAYMGKAPYMIRQQLMLFTKLGFVYFDFDQDLVTLRPKLYDYIDASMMQRDYDVIRFVSRVGAGTRNAKLDLQTKDLTIHGIPTIFLSDSQNVRIVPRNNTITMKRNRDFQFDGIIDAGLFKFYGNNFFFEYETFRVNLQNIDSLSISARTDNLDETGKPVLASLDNMIENITGELLIDAPFNKSGLADFPEYPIFTSRENSFVYFDEKTIQDGVYERERFYFELEPFSIDSLDNFRREALSMKGTFVSADILPPLDMEMSLRPDNSLGFHMTAPEEGIDLYGGKATFYQDIEMSSSGLRGYGSMDYLTSTTWSDNFLFHPDSVMARSRRFLERESASPVQFPYVENEITRVSYYPVQDEMQIRQLEQKFAIFNDRVRFSGDLTLRPSGLTGRGGITFPDARFDSREFAFGSQRIYADSSGVKFRKEGAADYTWITTDVDMDVDLVKRQGEFISRGKHTLVEMPVTMYETRLNTMNWNMDKNEVLMTQSVDLPENKVDIGIDSLTTSGPVYYSKHPGQDSLRFVAPRGLYNYDETVLRTEQVPFIEVGDAFVFPDRRRVEVLEKATIKPLRKAKILANQDARFHFFYNASLTIDSRLHYSGTADYDYVDEFDNVYTIHMDRLEVDTSIHTVGMGEVAVADSFRLSPFFEYQGQITLHAEKEHLDFLGGVRLVHDCNVGRSWLKFESEIDPDSIMIPVGTRMQNLALNNIYAGTFKARDSIHIYPSFLSGRKDYFDRNVTFSDGYLTYDKVGQRFEIADSGKLADADHEGNYLALITDACQLLGEGKIDLQLDYGRVGLRTLGRAVHDIPDNTLELDLLMGLDFHFSENALTTFGNELDSLPDLEPVDLTRDLYRLSVKNMVGEAEAEKMENELGLYGSYTEIPDSMQFAILFNEIHLRWNQETRSYRYNGKIGVGNIGNVQVNKKVDAYVEFVERGSGDIFDIYLQVDDATWYYFAYSPGALQTLSSNPEYNSQIMELSEKDRKLKAQGRRSSYIYSLSSKRRMGLFLDRFLMYEEQEE